MNIFGVDLRLVGHRELDDKIIQANVHMSSAPTHNK